MAPRKRFAVPTESEADVGKRLRQVRTDYGFSRSEVGGQIGMTPDQIKRIENGTVNLRFGSAWRLCEFTRTNPLWLAFGDLYPRIGFAPCPAEEAVAHERDLFQDTMASWIQWYPRYRAARLKISKDAQLAFAESRLSKLNFLAEAGVKRYLARQVPTAPAMTWNNLRERLEAATKAKGARSELARVFKVTTAAVSQWLSGDSAPKADTTLRLLQWVTVAEAQQKKRAGSALIRPALKIRIRKSKHEAPRSARKSK